MTPDLLQIPLPDRSIYNELAPDGVTPRPHWSPFIESLQAVGSDELARRWERAERRIRENGVTYNVYTDPQGANRPLAIDPIPLLIPPEEWRFIEAGIIQRAQLLNLLLEDIYGARQLVTNGDLPAALLFANPAFLRPLTGMAVPSVPICTCSAWTWRARPTAAGGCWPTARNRLRARDTRSRIEPSFRTFCRTRFAPQTSGGWLPFSARSVKRCSAWRSPIIREWSC